MTQTEQTINKLKDEIIQTVSDKLSSITHSTTYEIVWKELQDLAAEVVISVIQPHLKDSTITTPNSKSTYPDIKIRNSEGLFAIDVKSNESSKDPWYDMARLDTMMEDRIKKYVEEWELVIKYDSETGEFEKAYFALFREVVGYRKECSGVKFRPYDGKVRPKSWDDFEKGVVYFKTHENYLEGIRKSLIHRWKINIENILIPILDKDEITEFKELFNKK